MEERLKILEMVQNGIITPSEADELLQTLNCYDENKDNDKETLEKLKSKLNELYKKLEEFEKRASDKIANAEAYKTIEKEFVGLKNNVKSTIKTVDEKLDKIYNKSIKDNFQDLGNTFKKMGKKISKIFKTKEENEIIEIEEIKPSESEQNKDN